MHEIRLMYSCYVCGAKSIFQQDDTFFCKQCGWTKERWELKRYSEDEIQKIREGIEAGKTATEIAAEVGREDSVTGVAAKITQIKGQLKHNTSICSEEQPKKEETKQDDSGLSALAKDIIALERAGFEITKVDIERYRSNEIPIHYIVRRKGWTLRSAIS